MNPMYDLALDGYGRRWSRPDDYYFADREESAEDDE